MNINLVKTDKEITDAYVRGNYILETYLIYDGLETYYKFVLYDPKSKKYKEIMPEVKKHSFIPVINCMWNSKTIYFASYRDGKDANIFIDVYQYDTDADAAELVYTYQESRAVLTGSWKKIKVFVLSDTQLLFQTEQLKEWASKTLMGNIVFSQLLVNIVTGEELKITNLTLVNNGLNNIIPVSESQLVIKTGYSYIEDSRFSRSTEESALIESVYIGTLSQFISTISIEGASLLNSLGTAYFTKVITMPQAAGDFVSFSTIDLENNSSETLFYDYRKNESVKFKTIDIDLEQRDNAFVIGNVPYAIRKLENRTEFVNVKTGDIDLSFFDTAFVTAADNICIFDQAGIRKNRFRGYGIPKQELLFEQKGTYVTSCKLDDEIYIYFY